MKLSIEVNQKPEGLYRATCKFLPGCTADGSTPHEAVGNIQYAIRGYLAAINHCAKRSLQTKKLETHRSPRNTSGVMAS